MLGQRVLQGFTRRRPARAAAPRSGSRKATLSAGFRRCFSGVRGTGAWPPPPSRARPAPRHIAVAGSGPHLELGGPRPALLRGCRVEPVLQLGPFPVQDLPLPESFFGVRHVGLASVALKRACRMDYACFPRRSQGADVCICDHAFPRVRRTAEPSTHENCTRGDPAFVMPCCRGCGSNPGAATSGGTLRRADRRRQRRPAPRRGFAPRQ